MSDIKLYRITTNGLGTFYVVSNSFDNAAKILENNLSNSDYGISTQRKIISIYELGCEHFFNGKQVFSTDDSTLLIDRAVIFDTNDS